MPQIRWTYGLWIILFWMFNLSAAWGQSRIVLHVENQPLEKALRLLQEQTDIELIYAHRLISGTYTSCQYEGPDPEEALQCLLKTTPIRARALRPNQYVLYKPSTTQNQAIASISGFVIDAQSEEPLPSAHVYLPDLQIGSLTNKAGFFSLPQLPVQPYRIHVSFIGYRSVDTLITPQNGLIYIRLHPTAYATQEVVVKASVTSASTTAMPGSQVVAVHQLSLLPTFLGEPDLFRTLQWLPGIQRSGELGGELHIRGSSADEVLYLLDEVPIYHPWHTFGLFSIFQTEVLQQVQLFKGILPAYYGGRLSAVIDARMKDGHRQTPFRLMALSPISLRSVWEQPLNSQHTLMIAARRSYLDLILGQRFPFQNPQTTGEPLRAGYYFYDINGKWSYRPAPTQKFTVSFYQGGDKLQVEGPFQALVPEEATLSPLGLAITHRWGNRLASLRYQILPSHTLFLSSQAYLSQYKGLEQTFIQPALSLQVNSRYLVRITEAGIRLHADIYPHPLHTLQTGFHVAYKHFRSVLRDTLLFAPTTLDTLYQRITSQTITSTFYLEDTYQIGPHLQLTGGLRASFFSSGNYLNISPRFAFQYTVHPRLLILKGGIGKTYQYLHRLRDRFSYIYDLTTSRWIPASDDILPASAWQLAAGAEFPLSTALQLSADYYFRWSQNILLPADIYQTKEGLEGPGIDITTLTQQYRRGRNRAQGIELSASWHSAPHQLWLNYSWGQTWLQPYEEAITYPAPFDVTHSLRGAYQQQRQRFRFAVTFELRSGYPYHRPTARYTLQPPGTEEPIVYLYRPGLYNARLPLYFRVDISTGYTFQWLGASWLLQLQVFNVLNHRNVIGKQFRVIDDRVMSTSVKGLPIIPVPEIRIQW